MASHSTDFKDGIIFCELIKFLKGEKNFEMNSVKNNSPPSAAQSMRKISESVTELKNMKIKGISEKLSKIIIEDIYDSEEKMYEYLEIIKNAFFPEEQFSFYEEIKENIIENENVANIENDEKPITEIKKDEFSEPQEITDNLDTVKIHEYIVQKPFNQILYQKPITTNHTPQKSTPSSKMPFKPVNSEENLQKILLSGFQIDNGNFLNFPCTTDIFINFGNSEPKFSKNQEKSLQNANFTPNSQKLKSTYSISPHPENKMKNRTPSKTFYNPMTFSEPDASPTEEFKISIECKHNLLEWLENIQLIKPGAASIAEFPSYCRNGVLISDLILRLEGVFL